MCFLLTWQSLIEIQSYQNNDRLQLFQLLSSLRSITTTSVSCPPLSICDKDLQDTQHYCYHYLMQVYFYTSKWLMVVLSYTKKKHYFITNRYFYLTVLYYSVNIHILPWALFAPLASICIEGESHLHGEWGCSVAWCWVVVWVWQLAVKACPPCISSVCTALIWESHGGILFHTELGQGLSPL